MALGRSLHRLPMHSAWLSHLWFLALNTQVLRPSQPLLSVLCTQNRGSVLAPPSLLSSRKYRKLGAFIPYYLFNPSQNSVLPDCCAKPEELLHTYLPNFLGFWLREQVQSQFLSHIWKYNANNCFNH